jgi:hypothetical protein
MAQVTERSPNGVMGKTYSFTAKTAADPSAEKKNDYKITFRIRRSK